MADLKNWLETTLTALNVTDSMDRPEGFTRLGFSSEEKAAHDEFRRIAKGLGLETWQDEVGNQWALWRADQEAPTIGIGSHLDTVIEGGGYDGVAGILCGLGAIRELKRRKFAPKKNIAIVCFISEESARFGVSTIGSKALVGDIDKEKWEKVKDQNGVTIREAMEEYGLDWGKMDEAYSDDQLFESFIELHIEQGNELYKNREDIGIVNGIATPVRLIVTAYGNANHTGTTLMDERKDALAAVAPLIPIVREKALEWNQGAKDPLMATVSTVNILPNVMNVIPGEVELGIDIRSVDDELKKNFSKVVKAECKILADRHGIEIVADELVHENSILLDEKIQEKLSEICAELNLAYRRMNSGAGHDVMNIAKRWPSGLVFIPSVDGISHHPGEYTPVEHLETGVSVLAAYLEKEAGGDGV